MSLTIRCALAVLLGAAACQTRAADVLISTFGPADSYNGDAAFSIQHFPPDAGNPAGYLLAHAVRFTAGPTASILDTTRLAIFRRFNSGGLPLITIAADAGGAPGAALAAKTIPGFVPVDTPFQTETAPPVDVPWHAEQVLLQAGQHYWLSLHYGAPSGQEIYWYLSQPVAQGASAARGHGYGDPAAWQVFPASSLPAFSVSSVPVPEPAAAALAIAAVAAIGARRRSWRRPATI
ncbi:MAG TPA: hypothetical protein PKC18_11200 [Lacipirellulaceae bacterium]|nr:hypothetical protein [Lacipirellulaceae bacterium]